MMTPDPISPFSTEVPPANRQDVVPLTERNIDEERDLYEHNLASGEARPLTPDEKKVAEQDVPLPEPVYAPASERVARPPLPGDLKIMDNPEARIHPAESDAP